MSEYIEKKFSQLDCGLELGIDLRCQIYKDLHADWVIDLMNENVFWNEVVKEKTGELLLKSVRVSEYVFSDLYKDLLEIKRKLHVEDELIDIYVVHSNEINAYAMMSFCKDTPSIIMLHSALVNRLNRKQLQYVIGHEIGHIQNKDSQLNRLVDFFYDDHVSVPPMLDYRMKIESKIRELRADRCGFIASEDLEACISSFFLLQVGVDYNRFGDNFEGYLKSAYDDLQKIKEKPSNYNRDDHPELPIRVLALQEFANNENKKNLKSKTKEYVDLFWTIGQTEVNKIALRFYVSAGLMVATIDGKIKKSEKDIIEGMVEISNLFPKDAIDEIQRGNIKAIFEKSIEDLRKQDDYELVVSDYLQFLLKIVVADQEINKKEFNFVKNIAIDKMGVSEKTFSYLFAEMLRKYYHPITVLKEKVSFPF